MRNRFIKKTCYKNYTKSQQVKFNSILQKYFLKWQFLEIHCGEISRGLMRGCYGDAHLDRKIILNSDFIIIFPIMRVKYTVENLDLILLKKADQSHLVKIDSKRKQKPKCKQGPKCK